jgi:hypothetical protein
MKTPVHNSRAPGRAFLKNTTRLSRVFLTLASLLAVLMVSLLAASCEAFNFPLERFFIENTATIWIQEVEPAFGRVALGDDGEVYLNTDNPDDKRIIIPMDNYSDLVLNEDALLSSGDKPPRVSLRHELGKDTLGIIISGISEGDVFSVDITGKTAKEGRSLFQRTLSISCLSFTPP